MCGFDRFLGVAGSIFVSSFSQLSKFTSIDKWFVPLTIGLWLWTGNQRRRVATYFNPFVSPFEIEVRQKSGSPDPESPLLAEDADMRSSAGEIGSHRDGRRREGFEMESASGDHSREFILISTVEPDSVGSRLLDLSIQFGYFLIYIILIPYNDHSVLISYYYFMAVVVSIRLPILAVNLFNTIRQIRSPPPSSRSLPRV